MMERTEMRLNRELQNGDIGLRIHQQQRHPGAMIQAAPAIDGVVEASCVQKLPDACSDRWRAGCGITHVIKRAWEAIEVVDGIVAIHGTDNRGCRAPIARDREPPLQTL